MNSMPSIELHETYLEPDTPTIHPNLSCQHNTILTDRTFQHLPNQQKLSNSHLSLPKKSMRDTFHSASVTTADMTDFRSSLQEYTLGHHIPPLTLMNVLEKDETNQAEASEEDTSHQSNDKSLSLVKSANNQALPIINTETIIPSDLYAEDNNIPVIPVVENAPESAQAVAIPLEQANNNNNATHQSQIAIQQVLEFYILIACVYILVFFSLSGQVPYSIILVFLSLVCSIKVIANLSHRELHERYHKALDWLSLSMIMFSALMRTVVTDLPLIPFVFPGFICTFLFWKFARPRTFYLKKQTLVLLRFLFWAQILLISLKIDGYVASWSFVFLMLFYSFVFIMSFSAGLFIITIVYLCYTLRIRSFDHTIIGLLWDFLNTVFAWIWGFGTLHLINKLEGNDTSFLAICMLIGFIHVVVLAVYTALFKNLLAAHMQATFGQNSEQTGNQRYIFETVRENIAYLVRVSSTYFTKMDEGFKIQDKERVQQWKQQILHAKMDKHHSKNFRLDKKEKTTNKEEIRRPKLVEQPIKTTGDSPFNNNNRSMQVKRSNGDCEIAFNRPENFGLLASKMCSYSQDDIDIQPEIKRPCLKNGRSEEGADENPCVVCFSAPPNAVFMDCGHGGICYECALEVWRRGENCVFCRNDIQEILKVSYLPGMDIARVIEGTKRNIVFE